MCSGKITKGTNRFYICTGSNNIKSQIQVNSGSLNSFSVKIPINIEQIIQYFTPRNPIEILRNFVTLIFT